MKLVTLNIWGGHVQEPLLKFISSHQDVDIFCLQEVYHNASNKMSDDDREVCLNILSKLQDSLPNHRAIFMPVTEDAYGIGIFVKNDIEVIAEGDISIHENPNYHGRGPTHSRKLQWVECRTEDDQNYFILNVHGLWNGMGKSDSPARTAQSQKIRNFLDSVDAPKILCGDLNLRPDTESINILEKGMNNLIRTHNVVSTRTSWYEKDEKYADYVFTSPEIIVQNFQKWDDEVSDHSPLFLEFGVHSRMEAASYASG